LRKFYWYTVGLGALVAVVGGVVWSMSSHHAGELLLLGGVTLAVTGLFLRLADWAMDRGKKRPAT
jgi:hypothetical protein